MYNINVFMKEHIVFVCCGKLKSMQFPGFIRSFRAVHTPLIGCEGEPFIIQWNGFIAVGMGFTHKSKTNNTYTVFFHVIPPALILMIVKSILPNYFLFHSLSRLNRIQK